MIVRILAALLAVTVPAVGAHGQEAAGETPFQAMRLQPGEPVWAPLLRLRAGAARFATDPTQRGTWLQLLAQAEATFGNYSKALRAWDQLARPMSGDTSELRGLYANARRVSAVDTLRTMADTARIIMVNERHHAASDRILTLELLPVLWARGFRYFAAEAFAVDTSLAARGYALDENGYTSEPVFAEVVREALRLGYTLVPYEAQGRQFEELDSLTPQQKRDYAQAANLYAATFARDPQARVLVHAGFDHIREQATPRWSPMAAYLRDRSGIDPVTVDQTSSTERSALAYGHPVRRVMGDALPVESMVFVDQATQTSIGAGALMVDLVVVRALGPEIDGRPAFLAMGGRRKPTRISVPECANRHCVLTAHRADEPDAATVLDRVELEQQNITTLFLPAEPVRLTLHAIDGTLLRRWRITDMP